MNHTEIVTELMDKEVPTIQIIKDMYQAFGMSEATTKRVIYNILNGIGDSVAYKGESDLLYVEQVKADGIAVSCAPEIKANNHTGYPFRVLAISFKDNIRKANTHKLWGDKSINSIHENGKTMIEIYAWSADQTPESYMHQCFIDYTNGETNRA